MKDQPKKRTKKQGGNKARDIPKEKEVPKKSIEALLGVKEIPVVIAEGDLNDPKTAAAIEHALERYFPRAVEQYKTQKIMEEDLKALEARVSEYLNNFIVLGYDLSGEKIQIFHASSQQGSDSLLEFARGAFLSMMVKAQQNLPPGFPPPF